MKAIRSDEIEIIKLLSKGKYSYTFIAKYNNEIYCFKNFRLAYDDFNVLNRLSDMTELDYDKQFLIPKYMITDKSDKIIGYLSNYYDYLINMEDDLTFYERLELIKSSKENIEILHDKYKRVHGDLHFKNFLADKDNLQSYMLDFDLSLSLGEMPIGVNDYTLAVQNYLKYYPFDENVDIYHFNLCTVQYLANYYDNWKLLLCSLDKVNEDIPGVNKDVKRLTKELLLKNTKKSYSGEYIIDYI